jgi:hypothetical protein
VNRREAAVSLGALVLAACSGEVLPPEVRGPLSVNVYVHSGFANPRPEYGRVPGTQAPWEYPWASMKKRDRIPAMGEYDESQPWVTEYRLALMQSVGIGSVIYQVEFDHAA